MTIEKLISGRRSLLQERLATRGLSLHEAMFYFGDYSLLYELVGSEPKPTDQTDTSWEKCLRGLLKGQIRQMLSDGVLQGHCLDDGAALDGRRRTIPSDIWDKIDWRSTTPKMKDEPAIAGISDASMAAEQAQDGINHFRSRIPADPVTLQDVRVRWNGNNPYLSDTPPPQRKMAKPSGYAAADIDLLRRRVPEVRSEKPNLSEYQICLILAPEAEGGGAYEAKQKRLRGRWDIAFPASPD